MFLLCFVIPHLLIAMNISATSISFQLTNLHDHTACFHGNFRCSYKSHTLHIAHCTLYIVHAQCSEFGHSDVYGIAHYIFAVGVLSPAALDRVTVILSHQQTNHMRLPAMAYAPLGPASELGLLEQIENLSSENVMFQKKISRQAANTKTRISEYVDELNELSEQLKYAEEDASSHAHNLNMSENICKIFKAEYDHMTSLLDSERTANKDLQSEMLRQCKHAGGDSHALQLQNDLLITKLAKA